LVSISRVDTRQAAAPIDLPADRPSRVAGVDIAPAFVAASLEAVGCSVQTGTDDVMRVTPPTWRPDLTDPVDLVEEVIRLFGYDAVPSRLPRLPSGRGLTTSQRLRRVAAGVLADTGLTEVLAYPFMGPADLAALGIAPDDHRSDTVALANPISEEQPWLRTTMLPGLLGIVSRNVGRGAESIEVFEIGAVTRWSNAPSEGLGHQAVRPSVEHRPSDVDIASLDASLPMQSLHLAAVLTGQWENEGWWGEGRTVVWSDAIEVVRIIGRALRATISVTAASMSPWHPGRCAEFSLSDGTVVGHAGELHPRVCDALSLPARTCALEIDLGALIDAHLEVPVGPRVSTFPVAKEDIALVVEDSVSVHDVEQAIRRGAGDLLESVRLFDVYTGPQVGQGRKSLAFSLRFRAQDRTLTADEVLAVRGSVVAQARSDCGAQQRA
jgi:phenylalanyl-tRNA synthetase beta chain